MKYTKWVLVAIFIVAVVFRLYAMDRTIYFGFDEARDALVSESIYLKGDIKLIGPPASGDTGIFHGPAFWYLVGPLYVLFSGNIYAISFVFRVINALGVFLVFGISKKMFSTKVALLAAFLFAVSFEQNQYAIYFSKEALALICWLIIMYVVVSIYKKEAKTKLLGLPIIALCFGLMIQFNIIYAAFALGLFTLLLLILPQLRKIELKSWILAFLAFSLSIATYVVEEIQYDFREVKAAINLIGGGYGMMGPEQSKYSLYADKFLVMFRDNVIGLSMDVGWQKTVVAIAAISFSIWMIYMAFKNRVYAILLIWLFTWIGIMMAGGHMGYYTNVGLGVSILIGTAILLDKLGEKPLVFWPLLTVIVLSNLVLINDRIDKGLITTIKPQPFMNLIDERKIIDQMYTTAQGRGFTLRMTGIPYKIPTVWYYLLREYGYEKYGYYPYWEHGNVAGYPGELPVPTSGTTCLRFLVREPMRGLPVDLVNLDQKEEDIFSNLIERKEVGQFVIDERMANAKDCHDRKP